MDLRRAIRRARRLPPHQAAESLRILDPRWEREFHVGLNLWRAGRLSEAVEALRIATETAPNPAPALYLGIAAADRGLVEQARSALDRAKSVSQQNPFVAALDVIVRFDEGDTNGAVQAMGAELGESPLLLGRILARIEREILKTLGPGLWIDEEDVAPQVPQNWSATKLLRRGVALLDQQRVTEARLLLERANELAPDNGDIQRALAVALIFSYPTRAVELLIATAPEEPADRPEQQGRPKKRFVDRLRGRHEVGPGEHKLQLATALFACQRHEESLALIESLDLAELPDLAYWATYVRGLCFVGLGRMQEAGDAFGLAIDFEPEVLDARAQFLWKILAER